MAALMRGLSMRGEPISCQVCKRLFKALKRCKRCKSTFYCSRECQIRDWPTHKLRCSALTDQTTGTREVSDISHPTEAVEIGTASFQNLTLDEETCKAKKQISTTKSLDDNARSSWTEDSTQESPAEQPKETKGSNLQSGELAESEHSTSTEDSIRDPVTIMVKTSRQKHHLTLDRQSPGTSLINEISRTICIPLKQLKLIHKGKIMNPDNLQEALADRAVFQAIGEVAESDDGLSSKDIECVMNQIKVDRNTAIKALRKTGSAIDAILYLGNK